ncbi:hypothetical protein K7432_007155 [Basidiobolus ranarum]|uniref:Zinc finger PHD-type domain-containing protein n=1 Tax=Basidiobolus ranarum TaxID=34480 RepID=A0ABR2WTQ7_9FUNG
MLVAAMSIRDINFPLNNTRFRTQVSTYSPEDINISDSELSDSSLSSDDEDEDSDHHFQLLPRKIPSNYPRKVPYNTQQSATKSYTPIEEPSSPESVFMNVVQSDEEIEYISRDTSRPIKADSHGQPVYCFCRNGYDGIELMVECDGCQEWFHGACVGLTPDDSGVDQHHYCTVCLTSLNRSMLHPGSRILSEVNKIPTKRLPGYSKHLQSPEFSETIVKLETDSELEETIDVLDDDVDVDDICPVCELECTCGMGSNVKKLSTRKRSNGTDSNLASRRKIPTRRRRFSISALSITTDSDDSENKKDWIKSRRKTKPIKLTKTKNSSQVKRKKKLKLRPEELKKVTKLSEAESDSNLIVDIEVNDGREDELGSLSCVSSDFVDIEGLSDSSEALDSEDIPDIPLEFDEVTIETSEDVVEEPSFTRSGWESSSFEEYSDFPSGWSDTESSGNESQQDLLRLLVPESLHSHALTGLNTSNPIVSKPSVSLQYASIPGSVSTSTSSSDLLFRDNSALTHPSNSRLITTQQFGVPTHLNDTSLKLLSSPPIPSCLNQQLYSKSTEINECLDDSNGLSHPLSSSNSQTGKRRRSSSTGVGSAKAAETLTEVDPLTIIPIDEVVDTKKLYSSSSSRSPSPEPSSKSYPEYLQALSRWDRIPIGTFRRSRRRTSAPKLSVSTAMKMPNSTLLSDHTLNVVRRNNNTGKIVINHGCSPLLYPVLDSHVHNYPTNHNPNEYEEVRDDTDPLLALFCVADNDDILDDPPNTIERVKNRKRKRNRRRR